MLFIFNKVVATCEKNARYFFLRMILTGLSEGTVPLRQEETRGAPDQPVQETQAPPFATGPEGHGDAWVDSVLGSLEDQPPCQHCLIVACITISEVTTIQVREPCKAPQKLYEVLEKFEGSEFVATRTIYPLKDLSCPQRGKT